MLTTKIKYSNIKKNDIGPKLKKVSTSRRVFANLAPADTTLNSDDIDSVVNNISYHVKFTVASVPPNVNFDQIYLATTLSVKERLTENWNSTYTYFERNFPKETNYISMEFLKGRSLSNALRNSEMVPTYSKALARFGPKLEELEQYEQEPGLGNGGLGRLASCFLDSIATCNYPGWGYSLRYRYGLFKQSINSKGEQIETPEPWLDRDNPWELKRTEINYTIKTNGRLAHDGRWTDTDDFEVIGYDMLVPGYRTKNCISLRLWSVKSLSEDLDLQRFNLGKYEESTEKQQRALHICAVLYPADCCLEGKELRLSQQYFLCSATIQDILSRFKQKSIAKNGFVEWSQLPTTVTIQMNDTHPSLSVPELMRILIDHEGISWNQAWSLTTKTINYTNHTLLPEALEKWHIGLLDKILPRLMQIIRRIHHEFCMSIPRKSEETEVEYKERIARLAILDHVDPLNLQPLLKSDIIKEKTPKPGSRELTAIDTHSTIQPAPMVRMAHLCVVSARAVNGVAALHTDILKREVLADFYDLYPHKFQNKTNGVTPRRWLAWCNPALSKVITKWLGNDRWITELKSLELLAAYADNPELQNEFREAKNLNKELSAQYLKETTGVDVPVNALFDIQIKRIHEYKRQLLNILGIVYRYKKIKQSTPDERRLLVPKVCIFGGKAFITYYQAKRIVHLIGIVANVINSDPLCNDILKVLFVPNYNVGVAERLIPAAEVCHQISTAGLEASGTSNMKFQMNGALTIGTLDGANVEILELVGLGNFFLFGATAENIFVIRKVRRKGHFKPDSRFTEIKNWLMSKVFKSIKNMKTCQMINCALGSLDGDEGFGTGDYFLVSYDFPSFIEAILHVDETYKNINLDVHVNNTNIYVRKI